jgi:ankyrin repeat protein
MADNGFNKISLSKKELSRGAESYIEITDRLFKKLAQCKEELQTASFIANNIAIIDEVEVRNSMSHFSGQAKSLLASAQSDYNEFAKSYIVFPYFSQHSSIFKEMLDCFAGKIKTLEPYGTTTRVTYKFIDLLIDDLKTTGADKVVVLKNILNYCQEVNCTDEIDINQSEKKNGNTFLMKAIVAGQGEVAKELIHFGADVTQKVKEWSPLAKACFNYDPGLIYKIVKASPGELSQQHFDREMTQLVVNADVKHQGCDLSYAMYCGHQSHFDDKKSLDAFFDKIESKEKIIHCLNESISPKPVLNNVLIDCSQFEIKNEVDVLLVDCNDF